MAKLVVKKTVVAATATDQKTAPKTTVKKVTPPTPLAKPEAKATTKVATPVPETKAVKPPSKHTGATSGLHVMEYQDRTFHTQHKHKLTDEQILADWRREFPNTNGKWVRDDREGLRIVAIVRRFYNERRHGNQKLFSDKPVPRYGDKGQVIAEELGQPRGAKKAEAQAA